MLFGLCNALATFQTCLLSIFSDMVEHYLEVFKNDFFFFVFVDSFDEFLSNLQKVLTRYEEKNLRHIWYTVMIITWE